jgi:F-type H+-transporting ATPase subunit epsilon
MAQAKQSAGDGVLRLSMVTPKGPIADEATDAVTAPGALGEFEVLPGHVPLLTQLHPGVLVVGERQRRVFAVSSGFLEVEPDGTVLVLVEQAVGAADVDVDAAKAVVAELAPKVKEWKGAVDAEFANLKARHDWAQAQLDARAKT